MKLIINRVYQVLIKLQSISNRTAYNHVIHDGATGVRIPNAAEKRVMIYVQIIYFNHRTFYSIIILHGYQL